MVYTNTIPDHQQIEVINFPITYLMEICVRRQTPVAYSAVKTQTKESNFIMNVKKAAAPVKEQWAGARAALSLTSLSVFSSENSSQADCM